MYHKTAAALPQTTPAANNDSMVVDGTMGFDDPMEGDGTGASRKQQRPPRNNQNGGAGAGGLYSDSMVRPNNNRRGRGFNR